MVVVIWYKLGDANASKLFIEEGANISNLRDAIKAQCVNQLVGVGASQLGVYAAGDYPVSDSARPFKSEEIVKNIYKVGDILIVVVPVVPSPPDELQRKRDANLTELAEFDVSCTRLGVDFLNKCGLESYAIAAQRCVDESDAKDMIQSLLLVYDKKGGERDAYPFSCIVASSGTGKTQLAATASLMDNAAARPTIYLYAGKVFSPEGVIQSFYEPHLPLWRVLSKAVNEFRSKVVADLSDPDLPDMNLPEKFGANDNVDAAVRYPDFTCGLCVLLHRIIFNSDTEMRVTLHDLRKKVMKLDKPLLFLDETPSAHHTDDHYSNVIVLRDVLRAIGICPVLMSTHSGAHYSAVPTGGDSRHKIFHLLWCRIFVHLPKFSASKDVFTANSFLLTTERPLVACVATSSKTPVSLTQIVERVKVELQSSKESAWIESPSFQLCQLFRTKGAENSRASDSHALVGQHFGSLVVSPPAPYADNTRGEVKEWMKFSRVRMVVPEMEPVLFLALTTWRIGCVARAPKRPMMPLVDSSGEAISVRQAFDVTGEDSKLIQPSYTNAAHCDGDDLEVIALASVTLASLQYTNEVLSGVALARFLSTVLHLMEPGFLIEAAIEETTGAVESLLHESAFTGVLVPACPCAESSFAEWMKAASSSPSSSSPPLFSQTKVGTLKRPASNTMRDGFVNTIAGGKVLHIECQDLQNGATTEILQVVVARMHEGYIVSILFTSSLNGMFAATGAWDFFVTNTLGQPDHCFCFLVMESQREPYWLEVGKNEDRTDTELSPIRDVTTHLVVIIVNGVVEPRSALHRTP